MRLLLVVVTGVIVLLDVIGSGGVSIVIVVCFVGLLLGVGWVFFFFRGVFEVFCCFLCWL